MIRRLIVAVLLLALASPATAEAPSSRKVWRIGFISSIPVPATALSDALRAVGLVEGQNVVIVRRVTEGQVERLPALAAELVGLNPDVIVAFWNPEIAAAGAATRSIPIVMVIGVDPVGAGLVASLARPGGNVTGSLVTEPAVAGKTLQTLKEAAPTVKRVGVLWNPSFTLPAYYREVELAARNLGMTLQSFESRGTSDFDPALRRIAAARPDALFVDGLAIPGRAHRPQFLEFVARQQLPTVFTSKNWVVAGGLLSYNSSTDEAWRRTGIFVDRILKGARPGDLPVERPTKFELVINLKTAKALGLTIPQSLLLQADEVIQ